MLNFQLTALRYPGGNVDLTDVGAVRKLVVWLENLKIREYKPEERKALADTQSSAWDKAFKQYLEDLECPVPATDLPGAVRWLVAFALNLDYEDNADKLKTTSAGSSPAVSSPAPAAAPASSSAPASSAPTQPASRGQPREQALTDWQNPAVVGALQQLVRSVLEAPGAAGAAAAAAASGGGGEGGEDLVDRVQAACDRLVCQVGPALGGNGAAPAWSAGQPPRAALKHVPLGFDLKGDALVAAAKALRLRHVQDLRRLQSQIDHALVEMQEYTANPKTDSSLGKVGR